METQADQIARIEAEAIATRALLSVVLGVLARLAKNPVAEVDTARTMAKQALVNFRYHGDPKAVAMAREIAANYIDNIVDGISFKP